MVIKNKEDLLLGLATVSLLTTMLLKEKGVDEKALIEMLKELVGEKDLEKAIEAIKFITGTSEEAKHHLELEHILKRNNIDTRGK